jgi:methylthioribulose-1-phosphate dehydratase
VGNTSKDADASKERLALDLVACLARIRARGWCEATSGNYSVALASAPPRLLITPSGVDKGRLAPGDLLEIDGEGRVVAGAGRPSDESALHVTLVREAGAGAVLHTHSVWGTLLGERFLEQGGFHLGGYEMLKGLAGVSSHEERVFVPVVGNSQDMNALAGVLERLLRDEARFCGFLIAGHGLYTWGRDLPEAYRHVEAFEFLFQVVGRRIRWEPFEGGV